MIKKKIKKANFLKYSKNLKSIKFKDLKKLEYFSKNNNTNSRFCFHKDVGDKHQEMIILQKKFSFFPPKKNTKSDQTFLILRGRLLILTFNKFGKVMTKNVLSKDDNLLIRIKKNTFHCDIPLSKYTIHLETKNGKFDKNMNKISNFDFDFKSFKKNFV